MTTWSDPLLDTGDDGFRRFAAVLGRRLDVDLAAAGRESLLRDDLGFDSLAMAEVLVLLADRDVRLPDELIPALRTLGDLYHYAGVLAPRPPAPVADGGTPAITGGSGR